MIIKVKTLVFCAKIYEDGDVHVMKWNMVAYIAT